MTVGPYRTLRGPNGSATTVLSGSSGISSSACATGLGAAVERQHLILIGVAVALAASAVAQGTELLLLDEPTTFLDMAHQLEVLKLLECLNREQGRTIVMVLHDLNHASRFATHMVAIAEGEVVAEGSSQHVMTPEMLARVFAIEAEIIRAPAYPFAFPTGSGRRGIGVWGFEPNPEHQTRTAHLP